MTKDTDERIVLVRHGEAAARWGEHADPGLSELGREQAERASATLLDMLGRDVTVLSSPLLRARQTAQPYAAALGVETRVDETFREIPTPADRSGRRDWLGQFMRQTWNTQAETLLNWRSEMLVRLVELQAPAVIFTHYMVLNAVVGRLTNRDETVCFRPDNASITELRRNGKQLCVHRLGAELATIVN